MKLNTLKITSIKKVDEKRNVYDLSVAGTHSFYITDKQILTSNCDFMTASGQAILRELVERHSANTRFLLTANYIEKIIPAIQSRMQTYQVEPPSKKDVAIRVSEILTAENVQFTPMDIKVVVDAHYSDIRKIIGECQRQVIDGELKLDRRSLIEANYVIKAIDILKSNKSAKESLSELRQLLADSQVKDFTPLFQILYDKVDEYSKGHTAEVILKLAEYEYQHQTRLIKEMSAAAALISILELIR